MNWGKAISLIPSLVKLGVAILRSTGNGPKKQSLPPIPKVVRIRDVKRPDPDQEN